MLYDLKISFSLELSFPSDSHGGGGAMSENWAVGKAAMLRKHLEDTAQSNAVLLENRKLIEEQGPGLWEALRKSIGSRCEGLNRESRENAAVVLAAPHDELDVEFRWCGTVSRIHAMFKVTTGADALKWSYSGPAASQGAHGDSYMLYPINGKVSFCRSANPTSPEDIAEDMMDGLLKGHV